MSVRPALRRAGIITAGSCVLALSGGGTAMAAAAPAPAASGHHTGIVHGVVCALSPVTSKLLGLDLCPSPSPKPSKKASSTPSPSASSTSSPKPSASASPKPTKGPLGKVAGTVKGVVKGVTNVLTGKSGSPSTPKEADPTPSTSSSSPSQDTKDAQTPKTKKSTDSSSKKETGAKTGTNHRKGKLGKATPASGPATPSHAASPLPGTRFSASSVQIPDFSLSASSAYATPERPNGVSPLIAPQMLDQATHHSAQNAQSPTIAELPQSDATVTAAASPRSDPGGTGLPISIVIIAAVGVGAIGAAHVGLLQRRLTSSS